MLNVTDEIKALLKGDNCEKEIDITLDGLIIGSEYIYRNSMSLTESIISNNLEITGCISSCFKIKINTASGLTKKDYHGLPIMASMKIKKLDGTLSSQIPLFNGYVDTVEKDADESWQEFTCFDALYYIGSTNVYNWYNNKYKNVEAGYPSFSTKSITLKEFRDNLFSYCDYIGLNIQQVNTSLPNDTMKIKKRFKNKDMTLMELLQGICQINGCFGIINREGKFEYRYIARGSSTETIGAYPSLFYPGQIYPSQPITTTSTGSGTVPIDIVENYEYVKHSDDLVNPIFNGITLRNNNSDAGVTWSSDIGASTSWEDDTTDDALIDDDTSITAGTYILDGNMFAYKIKKANKKIAIANIYAKIGKDTYFRNHECKLNGLPYLECGDKVIFKKTDGNEIEFIITKRELSGDQFLRDVYSADCIDKLNEYVATGQMKQTSSSNSLSTDEVADISQSTAQDVMTQSGVLYIKSFSGGILETTSTPPSGT